MNIRKKKGVSESKEEEESLGDLAADDSFFHPPSSSKKIGKHLIKNYEKRSGRHAAPPPSQGLSGTILLTTTLSQFSTTALALWP